MEVSTILVTATRDLFSPVCGAISVCFDTDCGCSFCALIVVVLFVREFRDVRQRQLQALLCPLKRLSLLFFPCSR